LTHEGEAGYVARVIRSLQRLVLASSLFFVACASPGRQAAWEKSATVGQATATSSAATAALEAEAAAAWDKRDDRAALETSIKTWEKIAELAPNDARAMTSLSRAYYFLVDRFVSLQEGDVTEEKLAIHQKGVDWGEKALLAVDPKFGEKMKGGAEFEQAIKEIGKEAIPAAYWYCTNLGRFANAKGLSARLFYKDRIAAAMERILELDRPYFHYAADRFFGAFYSALPSIAGKDLDKSKSHFESAVKNAPEYLANKLLMADFLAVQVEDEKLYRQLLKEVLDGAEGDDPDYAPENRTSKLHAKRLLELVDDRF
jgi:hypothetical protein